MSPKDIAAALRTIYGPKPEHTAEFAALMRHAQNPTEDSVRQLTAFGLNEIVQSVLIDGMELAEAGKAAAAGRYSTDTQARAYAVAQIHVAGRALLWNEQVFAPHRRMTSDLAERYRVLKAIRTVGQR